MTVLDRVDTDRITARARQARPGVVAVKVIAFFFWAIFWLIAKVLGYSWFAAVWVTAACAEGFSEGFRDTPWGKARMLRAAARAAAARG
jgi:fatty acid desaturase